MLVLPKGVITEQGNCTFRKGRIIRRDIAGHALDDALCNTADILDNTRHTNSLGLADRQAIGLTRVAAIEQRAEARQFCREFCLGQRIA